jgi:hypothetical protein
VAVRSGSFTSLAWSRLTVIRFLYSRGAAAPFVEVPSQNGFAVHRVAVSALEFFAYGTPSKLEGLPQTFARLVLIALYPRLPPASPL